MWDLETIRRMNARAPRAPGAKRPLFYMAHPVTQDPVTGERSPEYFPGNVRRATEWLSFLIDSDKSRVYIAPWIAEVQGVIAGHFNPTFDEALRDDIEVVTRCDGLILTGGVITKGMQQELDKALELELDVIDLTALDYMPPRSKDQKAHIVEVLSRSF